MKPETIIPVDDEQRLFTTWDLGRRCNFDCSYCPAHRHDLTSTVANMGDLITGYEFVSGYFNLLKKYTKIDKCTISFTGGEPFVNPLLIDLLKFIKEQDEIKTLSVTSNGYTSQKRIEQASKYLKSMTISYHCENTNDIKKKVKNNILLANKLIEYFKVNVMFHAKEEYFNECLELCEELEKNNVGFIPRWIGEVDDVNSSAHEYNEEQLSIFKSHFNINSPVKKGSARSMGRPCCGGKELNLKCGSSCSVSKFVENTEFKGYNCLVNFYWLHIEQQNNLIYQHQTCQALLRGKRGPVGSLNDSSELLKNFEEYLNQDNIPLIKCPNNLCNCGLCIPKSKHEKEARKLLNDLLK